MNRNRITGYALYALMCVVRLLTFVVCLLLAIFCIWQGTELEEAGNNWGGLLSFGGAIAATLIWVAVCVWTEDK